MGLKTLVSLAELKMHIRDEHVRNGAKSRLKRHFGAPQDVSPPTVDPTTSSFNLPQSATTGPEPLSTASATVSPTLRPLAQQDPSATENPHLAPQPGLEEDSAGNTNQSDIHNLAQQFLKLVEEERRLELEEEREQQSNRRGNSSGTLKVTIADLFDFSRDYWVSTFQKVAAKSLEEEEELFELLMQSGPENADGEDDHPLDDSVEALLTT